MDSICTIEDCERPVKVKLRGLCGAHYERWRQTASPDELVPNRRPRAAFQELLGQREVEFQPDGCINWMGEINDQGYGVFTYDSPSGRRHGRAHRYAYEYLVGPIPDGMEIDHRCGNRRCLNPEHLRVTTRKQNMENLQGANRNSDTGVRGVVYIARLRKYQARVKHNYKVIHVGCFSTLAEAEAAVIAKRLELFTHNETDRNEVTHGNWWGVAL